MKNKKRAGFKMKKSPNKSRFAAGTDPEHVRKFNQSMYGSLNEAPKPGNQTYGSYMGVPVKGNPVKPRGLFGGMADIVGQSYFGSRPKGLFGGGPRRPRPRLYGRPKRGNFMSTILDRLRDQMPPRLGGRPNPRVKDGGSLRDAILNNPRNRGINPDGMYSGGGRRKFQIGDFVDDGVRTMSAMAKKSGFNMKKGSKPNKSEFFKGKK